MYKIISKEIDNFLIEQNPKLSDFLSPFDSSIQKLTLDLRRFVIDTIPHTNELIWDNYNAVAIAYSKSQKLADAFCHISVYAKHVNFGFNRGAELTKSDVALKGTGKLIRHITVKHLEDFPKVAIKKMLLEAKSLAEKRNPALLKTTFIAESIVMSISKKKRRPNKAQ